MDSNINNIYICIIQSVFVITNYTKPFFIMVSISERLMKFSKRRLLLQMFLLLYILLFPFTIKSLYDVVSAELKLDILLIVTFLCV